jgi:hypothetical protein
MKLVVDMVAGRCQTYTAGRVCILVKDVEVFMMAWEMKRDLPIVPSRYEI